MLFVYPGWLSAEEQPKAVRRAVAARARAVREAEEEHRAVNRPLLTPALQCLQDTDMSDGLIRWLRIDPQKRTLRLVLRCGDLITHYKDAELTYRDIQLTPQETTLLCFVAHHAYAELDRDEIDVETAGYKKTYIHRIAWNTTIQTASSPDVRHMMGAETEFRFGGFGLKITPRPDRILKRPSNFITVVRGPSKIEGVEDSLSI